MLQLDEVAEEPVQLDPAMVRAGQAAAAEGSMSSCRSSGRIPAP